MRNLKLASQLQKIENAIHQTNKAVGGNIGLQAHWGKYLCILVAGFLENAIKEIYTEFVDRTSIPQVANFAKSRLQKIQNPKSSRFVEIARAFKEEWGDELEDFLNQDHKLRKNAIDSIMDNRNRIAHGKFSSNITVARVHDHLNKSVEIIEFIEKQCQS